MNISPPTINIDLHAFSKNPYPTLAKMRAETPICFVPQLNAVLFTNRDDIFTCEKNIEVFSSEQPGGLMTQQMFPAVSPKTVRNQWKQLFQFETAEIIKNLIGFSLCLTRQIETKRTLQIRMILM